MPENLTEQPTEALQVRRNLLESNLNQCPYESDRTRAIRKQLTHIVFELDGREAENELLTILDSQLVSQDATS